MIVGQYVAAQLLSYVPDRTFRRFVEKYSGNYKIRKLSCWSQFVCIFFGQLTFRESLSQIVVCLNSREKDLYHFGIRHSIAKSTLAEANESRNWKIYRDLALKLIERARILYRNDDHQVDIENTIYALDSSTIDLCLNLFPWAKFRRTKGAVKLHTLIDLRGPIPTFIEITTGKVSDVTVLDSLDIEPDAFYVMDRAYVDFLRLYRFTQQGAFFVTGAKRGMRMRVCFSRIVDKTSGLRCDQDILLKGRNSSKNYPEKLRRIAYWDEDTKKRFVFLTNNFHLEAKIIPQIYKQRWQIELFFKWIKQHLRIKKFYGTSKNAVQTQVWIGVCVYVLIAIVKRELRINHSVGTILDIWSINPFSQVPLLELLTKSECIISEPGSSNQLEFNYL